MTFSFDHDNHLGKCEKYKLISLAEFSITLYHSFQLLKRTTNDQTQLIRQPFVQLECQAEHKNHSQPPTNPYPTVQNMNH